MAGRLRSLIANILSIEGQDNCQYIPGVRWSERLKMPPEHCWNTEAGAVLLKSHERLLMKKLCSIYQQETF